MDNVSLIERLAQAEDSEVGEAFGAFMQTAARTALVRSGNIGNKLSDAPGYTIPDNFNPDDYLDKLQSDAYR